VAEILTAIDVGTTKICTLVAEVAPRERPRVIGVGVVPSHGLRKGSIVDVDEATQSIARSIAEAERVAGYSIPTAYVGIAGNHISSMTSRGVTLVGRGDRMITALDAQHAMDDAQNIAIPHNRQVLHAIARSYTLDGQDGIRDPAGMVGYRLEVEAHIVTAATASIQNVVNCVRTAGVEVISLVLQPLASAEAVLRAEEKQMGVVLVDVGGGTTDIAIYMEGSVWHTQVLTIGGDHLTNDIAVGLRTPFEVAEELKTRYGHAIPDEIGAEEMVDVNSFGDGARKLVARQDIAHILNARADEMIGLVLREIKRTGYDGLLAAGLVLTGGSAELAGLKDLAEQRLQIPVRVGLPRGLGGMGAKIKAPAYATAAGLLLWSARDEGPGRSGAPEDPIRHIWSRVKEGFRLLLAR
jgi:cell division protein FtsA